MAAGEGGRAADSAIEARAAKGSGTSRRSAAVPAAVTTVAVMAATVLALGIGCTTAYLQWRTAYRIPSWDEWGWIRQYREIAARGLRLDDLLAQWNEHRLVFPRLVFLLDMRWARGTGMADRVASDLLQGLTLATIVAMGRAALHGGIGAVVVCFSAMLLLSAAQGDNVYMGFQVQFVMVYTAAVVAVALAASAGGRLGTRAGIKRLLVLWGAATVATFSMANGIGAWPIVTVLLVARSPRAAVAAGVVGAVEALVFLHGYRGVPNPDHTGLAEAAANAPACASYLLTYLGAVLAPTDPASARLGGCAALALMAWWGWRHRGRFAGPDPWPRFAAGVSLFVLFSAAVTAVGRFKLGDDQALSSRYLTPGAVLWSVLGLAVAVDLDARLRSRAGARAAATACLACLAAAVGLQDEVLGVAVMTNQTAGMPLASDAYVVGVKDSAALGEAATDIPLAWSVRSFLEDRGLGPFSEAGSDWLGKPASSLLGGRTYAGCAGSIEDRAAAGDDGAGGAVLVGWAWGGADGLPSRVLVADVAGSVVGLARTGLTRPEGSAAVPGVASDRAGFQGYARAHPSAELRLFAVSHDGRALCEIASGP